MILEPALSSSSEEFQANQKAMEARMAEFKKRTKAVFLKAINRLEINFLCEKGLIF